VIVYITGGVGVVGKFDCDRIIHSKENMPEILANGSCMTEKELLRFSRGRGLCGWHVQEGSVCEYEMPIPLKRATGLNRPPKTLCYLRKTE
jgi:predicted transcriptional regulator